MVIFFIKNVVHEFYTCIRQKHFRLVVVLQNKDIWSLQFLRYTVIIFILSFRSFLQHHYPLVAFGIILSVFIINLSQSVRPMPKILEMVRTGSTAIHKRTEIILICKQVVKSILSSLQSVQPSNKTQQNRR